MSKARNINKAFHDSPSDETFAAKVDYAKESLQNGKATLGVDYVDGRKMHSVSFGTHYVYYRYHVPFGILSHLS